MSRLLRGLAVSATAVMLLLALGYAAAYVVSERKLQRTYPVPRVSLSLPTDAAAIAEGQRLAVIRGCYGGCHGRGAEGAVMFDDPKIARIVAPDLTAAAAKYDAAQLAAIIRNGVRPDGRSMIVMPSEAYAGMSDADTARIIAFLKSLPRAAGTTAPHDFGPLGRVGLAVGKFKVAAEHIAEAAPAPAARAAGATDGRYLATTICTQCHGTDLRGYETPSFTAPDLRVTAAYSPEAFKALMREGRGAGGRELGMMGQWSRDHFARLTDAEIEAMYVYLRAL